MKYPNKLLLISVVTLALFGQACEKLIEVPPPDTSMISDELFKTDASATSAVTGIYTRMNSLSISFNVGALTVYPGLSADELTVTSATPANAEEFLTNSIAPDNGVLNGQLWDNAYVCIYQVNACIAGLRGTATLSPSVKSQLLGECLTLRAFFYFNLMNVFGKVPLLLTPEYKVNMISGRSDVAAVKTQILQDLNEAEQLLTNRYPSAGVGRPNRYVASALKARYYLYEGNWTMAEEKATEVIESGLYELVDDLNKVFLANSKEGIWQLVPTGNNNNTTEGKTFIPGSSSSAAPAYAITEDCLDAFEATDQRRTAWTATKTVSGQPYTYPFKYKVPSGATSVTEYYMVFRLAELYLIRAEARAHMGNLTGSESAVSDLNEVRERAGLLETSAVTQDEVIAAVEQERRVELFCEWGHRWFDLRRWNKTDAVLSPIKPDWQSTDVLYPIPEIERLRNRNLDQNAGYN